MAPIRMFCRHVVARTDRELRDLGRGGDLADPPLAIAAGDHGTLDPRPMRVAGRVPLDDGAGRWDAWDVVLDDGAWHRLADAQGAWTVTTEAEPPHALPLLAPSSEYEQTER